MVGGHKSAYWAAVYSYLWLYVYVCGCILNARWYALVSTGHSTRGEWRCMQPQRCHLCNKTFSNSGNLRQHVSNVHTPGQQVPCNVCARVFKNKEYLRKHHVQAHNAPLRRPRSMFYMRTMWNAMIVKFSAKLSIVYRYGLFLLHTYCIFMTWTSVGVCKLKRCSCALVVQV